MTTLVLVRHGQSMWNLENRFTGWADVDLSERGIREAREAGNTLKEHDFTFDVTMTSYLKRSIRTLWVMLDALDQMHLPIQTDWRLNERHYGALQGLNKAQTAAKHGADQVEIWRRSSNIAPPAVAVDDQRHPSFDPRYGQLKSSELPTTESLEDTLARVEPYWRGQIVPELLSGRHVLIAAHGNSLRALVKILETISDAQITKFNIPTGIPRLYELDQDIHPIRAEYLGDSDSIAKATQSVADQAKI